MTNEGAHPWKYQGDSVGIIPGVPARDLTDAEYKEAVDAGRIVADEPTGAVYKKAAKAAESKGAK